jgi:hypothetical protein
MVPEYLVISFIPLLRATPGQILEMGGDDLERILDTASDLGHVHAIIWGLDDAGASWPVLVIDRAREIVDHLLEWSESNPAEWFEIHVEESSSEYTLALVPRMDMSIERFRAARLLFAGEVLPPDARFRVISCPIVFSGPRTPTTPVLDQLPDPMQIGFLDRARLPERLEDLDAGHVIRIGAIGRRAPHG